MLNVELVKPHTMLKLKRFGLLDGTRVLVLHDFVS